MARYAKGKRAVLIDDRSGFKIRYKDARTEWTGSRVHKKDFESNIEMPPQRDIRDTQPTISVNYRVVKNMNDNNFKKDQTYPNQDIKDDWDNADNDW